MWRWDLTSILSIAFGMALFAVILFFNYQDLLGIRETLRQTPLGLAISFSCHVPQMVLMALAWRRLLPMALRPALSTMLVLRWIRESLNALIPAGAIIGQAVAAQRLIRAGVAADLAAATATVDMTIEGATQALFTLAGLLLLLAAHRDLRLAQIVVIGISVAAAATAAMVVVQRNLPVRLVEAAFAGVLGRWLALKSGWLADFQRSVLRLHADRRSLVQAASYHLITWTIGAVEISGIIQLFGHPISLSDGFVVESLTQALRSAGFMVPGALGLQEGAIIASCGLVGVPPDVALVLALLRRAREVLIGVPGLWAWRRLGPPTSIPTTIPRPLPPQSPLRTGQTNHSATDS
jgi:putative membrane protein